MPAKPLLAPDPSNLPAAMLETCGGSRTPARVSRNIQIAELHLQGLDSRDIAPQFNITDRQVRHILKTDECVRMLLEDAVRTNVVHLHKAIDVHDSIIDDKEVSAGDRLKAINMRYKITGVTPSHVTNKTIQHVHIDNSITVQGAESKALDSFAKFTLSESIPDTIDGELAE